MGRPGLIAIAVTAAVAVAGCGSSAGQTHPVDSQVRGGSATTSATSTARGGGSPTRTAAHPQAIEPVAGAGGTATGGDATAGGDRASVSVGGTAQDASLPHPQSVSEVRQQLAASGMTASTDQATLTTDGLAIAPVGAPAAVQQIIDAGNQISHLPYIWGGGHMTYQDTGYDCSGSLSYVLAAAHLLDRTMTSGELENWGRPGPGKWITVFATGGHTFMYVAGLRFDTVALAETGTRWSANSADEPDLGSFVERHPAGL